MALLPFSHQEFMIVNRRQLEIDGDNDLVSTLMPENSFAAPPQPPNTLTLPIAHDQIGVRYDRIEVGVFGEDLRCMGRKATQYFFLTDFDGEHGVCTHIDLLVKDPGTYMRGLLRDNMLRIGNGMSAPHMVDMKLRELIRQSREAR